MEADGGAPNCRDGGLVTRAGRDAPGTTRISPRLGETLLRGTDADAADADADADAADADSVPDVPDASTGRGETGPHDRQRRVSMSASKTLLRLRPTGTSGQGLSRKAQVGRSDWKRTRKPDLRRHRSLRYALSLLT